MRTTFPKSTYIDLLEDEVYRRLLARPDSLGDFLSPTCSVVILDEVQKVPALLDEVHRLIERRKMQFILTGSSARKLKRQGVNLLAGRALTYSIFPMTAKELGSDFNLQKALKFGHLPMAVTSENPRKFLESYVRTYLKEEVEQEGLTRNLGSFARFLEAASFSQASLLSISQIASDAHVHRKVVEDYFGILRDLLLSYELPVFTRRAKREMMTKRKFYFFDVGLFRTLRPKGPLDSEAELNGASFETLCLQELLALNHYLESGYEFFHWRTRKHQEVDLVLYGERGLLAFEFKASSRLRESDFAMLRLFGEDYPQAKLHLVYGGNETRSHAGVRVLAARDFFSSAETLLR
ncbi:MAG: ATP-binding protein [Bdellovibrionaceae bacterium]|nr:ATP-binding protein [Pseudobdellovibrionaceae bacterium]